MKKFCIVFVFFILIIFLSNDFVTAEPNFTYSTPQTYKYNPLPYSESSGERILFIVDFSNSMNEKLGHRTKLDIALSTMKEILQMIPPQTSVGLRVYGHKTGFTT